jgi:transposase
MDRLERLKNKGLDEDEWQKSWNKYQQQYIRKRLQAIKYLHEGQSRKEVIVKLGCARESIATWLDMYDEQGLKGLTKLVKRKKTQSLSKEQKAEMKVMLLEQKPTTYGIDRQIWTGKIIQEVIQKKWEVELKDSRIYDILKEMGLSHQKAHRDYENADKEQQQKFIATIKKKLQELKPRERLIFYDEFAVYDRPSLYYAWAERNSKPEVPSNEKRKRNKVNGMISVDAVTGEIYLQLNLKSKTEDVVKYLAELCEDARKEDVEKLFIVLDNNSTHKQKMKRLLAENLKAAEIDDEILIEFIHTPAYSPSLNLAEYEIHLLRLEKLHHLPANTTIAVIEEKLKDVHILMNSDQISKTLKHIFSLVPLPIL